MKKVTRKYCTILLVRWSIWKTYRNTYLSNWQLINWSVSDACFPALEQRYNGALVVRRFPIRTSKCISPRLIYIAFDELLISLWRRSVIDLWKRTVHTCTDTCADADVFITECNSAFSMFQFIFVQARSIAARTEFALSIWNHFLLNYFTALIEYFLVLFPEIIGSGTMNSGVKVSRNNEINFRIFLKIRESDLYFKNLN